MSKAVWWAGAAAVLSVGACAAPAPKYAVVPDPLGAGAAVTAEAAATAAPEAAPVVEAPVVQAEVETPRAAPLGRVDSAPLPVLSGQPQSETGQPSATAEAAPRASLAPAVPGASGKTHVVGVGDTFFAIGRRYGVGPLAVAQANGLTFGDTLRLGQTIQLPAGATDRGPEAARATGIRRADALTAPVEGSARASLVSLSQEQPAPTSQPQSVVPAQSPGAAVQSVTPAPVQTAPAVQPPPVATPPVAQAPVYNPPAAAQLPVYNPPPLQGAVSAPPAVSAPAQVVATPRGQPTPSAPVSPPAGVPAQGSSSASLSTVAPGSATLPAQGRFVWPLRGNVLTRFGPTGVGQRSDGVTIATAEGTPVRAAAAGTVVYAGDQVKGGFGKLVLVEHEGRWFTAYAHLSDIGVRMKDRVSQNQQLGLSGRTGNVVAPQLYFEVRHAPTPADRARPVDPLPLLPQ